MSTFSPKRPNSRAKVRYSPSGPNVTYTRGASPSDIPGTAVYGLQEVPVKKPQKARFEKCKAVLNEKNQKPRPSIKTAVGGATGAKNRPNPIAMNPLVPTGNKKDLPTFRSSPGNPLNRQPAPREDSSASLRTSSRFAARFKFEEARSKNPPPSSNKFESQKEAYCDVKQTKNKETVVLNGHPHGATQGLIHHLRPSGLALPGLGFGSPSCRS